MTALLNNTTSSKSKNLVRDENMMLSLFRFAVVVRGTLYGDGTDSSKPETYKCLYELTS